MWLALALSTARPPRPAPRRSLCAGTMCLLDDIAAIKSTIASEVGSAADVDAATLRSCVEALELNAPCDRVAGSPLLDGRWENVWLDGDVPRWRGPLKGRLTHVVDGSWLGTGPARYTLRVARRRAPTRPARQLHDAGRRCLVDRL